MNAVHTVVLANGVPVYAKNEQDARDRWPVRYANRKQAEIKAAMLRAEGHDASIYRGMGRTFYVSILPTR